MFCSVCDQIGCGCSQYQGQVGEKGTVLLCLRSDWMQLLSVSTTMGRQEGGCTVWFCL